MSLPRTLRRWGLALAWLALLATPSGAMGAGPADSPTAAGPTSGPEASPSLAADLAGSLLTASDLPAGMVSQGITGGSRFSIDPQAFADNGGLAVVNQIWQAAAQVPVAAVFDFRFAFPTADAAQAYLMAAEAALSEAAASGLSLVQDPTLIGDASRHYAGQGTANGATVDFQNFLFRVGPIAAKVFVAGYGTTAEDAAAIARTAAARIAAVSGSALPSRTPVLTLPPASSPARAGSSPSAPGAAIRQWAIDASASSEYSQADWSAKQATGAPDVPSYGDDGRAWAPANQDGTTEWLELTFAQAVVPTAIDIHESAGPGFVTKVEGLDETSGTWTTLWQGTDSTPADAIGVFSPPLAPASAPLRKLRVTIDTNIPGWNEIDAVELVGASPPAG